MRQPVDRRAVGRGVAAYLLVAGVAGVVIVFTKSSQGAGRESGWWVAAALVVVIVAPFAGGALAGAGQPTPLVHGGLAVALPAGALLAGRTVVGAVDGSLSGPQAVRFVFYLVVFTSLGMLGGYAGFRRRQHLA